MKFRTQYERDKVITSSGERLKKHFIGVTNKFGKTEVIEKGDPIDIYAEIQSYADSCDINLIIKKFTNGDTNALNQRQSEFIDLTKMPTSYNEMLNVISNAEDLFMSLSSDIRSKFDNDLNKFVTMIGNDDWLNVLKIDKGTMIEKRISDLEEKVIKEESVNE